MTPPSPCSYTTSNSFDEKACQVGERLVDLYDKATQNVFPLVQKDPPQAADAFVGTAAGLVGGYVIRKMSRGLMSGAAQKLGKAAAAGAAAGAAAAASTAGGAAAGASAGATMGLSPLLWPLLPFTLIDDLPKLWGGDSFSDTFAKGLENLFGPAPSWLIDLADDLGL